MVPEVKASRAASSRPVAAASNRTGLVRAIRASSASWLAVPSKPTTCSRNRLAFEHATSSSIIRVSQRASRTRAFSTIRASSPARSIGMVFTTTAPALVAASQHPTIAGLLAERTTPQPKVSPGALRSNPVISWAGLRSFRLIAK